MAPRPSGLAACARADEHRGMASIKYALEAGGEQRLEGMVRGFKAIDELKRQS